MISSALDFQLVAWQVNDSYEVNNEKLRKYIEAYEKEKEDFS